MTLMFLTSMSNGTHIMWPLCSYLVPVKPCGTGYGNWSVLLACHCCCCAGVKLMYICPLVFYCIYIEGPELAFCSCYPPNTFTRPWKIPSVMLPILLFRGTRYGTLCTFEQVTCLGMSFVSNSAVLQNPYFHTSVSLELRLPSQYTACFNVASSQNE